MHQYSAELRIIGEKIDPKDITRRLAVNPSQTRVAGERRSEGSVWRESLWAFDGSSDDIPSPKVWESLEDGLVRLLQVLECKGDLIRELVLTEKCEVIWWCGHFQSSFDGGPTLSVPLLKRLASFGVPLFIDNYHTDNK